MNTLRRISRPLVKTVAVGAVMVAAALPAMALTGTAGAATTAPTLTCTNATLAASPTCSAGFAVIGQGFAGNFVANGTGFANDQAVGGTVTLTTTAPGVSFSNVNETSATNLTAAISSTSATTPGFYPVTLTDTNGTATFTVGLGVDNGPQITTIAGNVGTAGGAASTVTVTGKFLNTITTGDVVLTGTGTIPAVSNIVANNAGTSLTFNVNNVGTPGTFGVAISSTWPTGAVGVASSSYTLNGAATTVSITSVTPNELGIPAVNPSTVNVTIAGTGFELGAVITAPVLPAGTTLVSSSFVNSTTITSTFTVNPGATVGEVSINVQNPDTSSILGTAILGIGEPATSTASGPAAPVAPAITVESGFLTPGTASIIHATGSSSFPLTTGSTVNVKQAGVTNPSESLTGTVVSVDATNNATIRVQVPRFASTPLTAASTAAAATLTVADTSGAATSGTLTVVDGASSQNLTYTGKTATSFTGVAGGTLVHAIGVLVEFPFPASTSVLTIGNGTNSETASVVVNAAPASAFTASGTGATLATLDPGTYSINAYVPGFGFATGSTATFQSFQGGTPNSDGVTGTVTVVNGNTATIAVTVPKVRSNLTGDHLTVSAAPGQNAITLNSVVNSGVTGSPNILVGDSLTINADSFYLTPETVTVTAVNTVTNVVSVTPALADNHTGGAAGVGATVTDNSDPQSTSDTVQAILTNGVGGADVINPFFGFTTAGVISSTQLAGATTAGVGTAPLGAVNTVGAGAKGAILNLALSQATDGSAVTAWTGSSTVAGVTFGAITSDAGSNITTTINVAPGTLANASVPISFTDGLETYSGTIAIVAGPTITAVTAVGNLTAGSVGFTVGVTGTNFVVGEMSCTTSDPAVGCVVDTEVTDSATTATVSLTPGAAMLNGSDSITLTYSGGAAATYGAGTLAGAFTVSGQPVVTAVTPTSIPTGTDPAITVTGTGFATAGTIVCTTTGTDAAGTATAYGTCTATVTSATSATITAYSTGIPTGDSVTFTFGLSTSVATTTPPISVQANPFETFIVSSSVLDNFTPAGHIAQGSTAVPFHIVGGNFLPGATVTLTADGGTHGSVGTATITSVTPNAIFGTVSILATAAVGGVDSTVTLPNGGSTVFANLFSVVAAPTIVTPASGTPKPILDGVATTLTITGTGFVTGAVVTGAVTGVDTFGTAVVTDAANPTWVCDGVTHTCDTIKVPVTPVSFSGSTPILDGLVVTNPLGAGSVTVQNDITVNPVPAVTGTYYVPTFTANTEVTINGTGFESGITASSANPDYTVLAVSSTPTTVTLLVSTDSNATSGTSSTITLTNPDGGSGTFPLNGGPNPNTATPKPHATGVHGLVHTGKTSIVTISGTHFYGQPHITSNAKGTTVRVFKDNGKLLTVRVTTKKTTPKGVHTFIIRFANGEQTNVKYSQGK